MSDGYRVLWRNKSDQDLKEKQAHADYAGTCALTVNQVYASLGELAKSSPAYRNQPRKASGDDDPSADRPDPQVYSCHTVVRLVNAMLGLNIQIATPDRYTQNKS